MNSRLPGGWRVALGIQLEVVNQRLHVVLHLGARRRAQLAIIDLKKTIKHIRYAFICISLALSLSTHIHTYIISAAAGRARGLGLIINLD